MRGKGWRGGREEWRGGRKEGKEGGEGGRERREGERREGRKGGRGSVCVWERGGRVCLGVCFIIYIYPTKTELCNK